jgi:hypothetical protein
MMFFVLVVSCVFLIAPCIAPVTVSSNPNVGPEFVSVVIHNTPIWKPPVINTNPYTGEVTSSKPDYWVQNGTVEITIKNHPFSSYVDKNGNNINTYYCVFYKYASSSYVNSSWLGEYSNAGIPLTVYQSDSDYTIIVFKYGEPTAVAGFTLGTFLFYEGAVSFRIQTVEDGYFERDPDGSWIFEGVGSEWVEFTVTIPPHDPHSDTNFSGTSKPNIKPTSVAPSTSNTSNSPQQNPLQSNLTIILVFVGIIAILLIVIAYLLYKQRKNKTDSTQTNPTTISTT